MGNSKSYLDKTFRVTDPDCRIREAKNLQVFVTYKAGDALPPGAHVGDIVRITRGVDVTVDDVAIANNRIFVHAVAADGSALGWTAAGNFGNALLNETFGEVPPANAQKQGANAAWQGGEYLGQVTLVNIVGEGFEPEQIVIDYLDPFQAMVAAATQAGVRLALTDGFRTYPDQKRLYDGYIQGRPGFNLAAKPGFSNHQHGKAFDLSVGGGDGDPVYDWLKLNAPTHGFVRTVNREPWHWEYRPQAARNGFKLASVTV
jgi:hypothetical protein